MTTAVSAARVADLVLPLADGKVAHRALAESLRLLVIDGRLPLGSRLPSERALVAALRLSRTTVTRAYDTLREEGYLRSRRGSGTVASLPDGEALRAAGSALVFPSEAGGDLLDLTCAALRAPVGTAEAYAAALTELPSHLGGVGYSTLGLPALRAAIAQRYDERGLPTAPDQVLITGGALSAVMTTLRVVARVGDLVAMEDPTFPNVASTVRAAGHRTPSLPVHATGWDLDTARTVLRTSRPAAAVLIPDFHNPTGALLDEPSRAELADALRAVGATPVVDETVCEMAIDPGPSPLPFAAFHRESILVGSSSKSHWGGLRTGWIRAPRALADRLAAARVATDPGAAILEQLVLLHLLRGPDRRAERAAELRAARDGLAAALRREVPQARFALPTGGLSLWVELPGTSGSEVSFAARRHGLLLAGGRRFSLGQGLDSWLRIPYVLAPAELDEAARRLRRAVADVQSGASSGRPPTRTRPIVA